MNVLIKNGHIIDPANNIDDKNDIYIADGSIAAVGKKPGGFLPRKPQFPRTGTQTTK